MEFIDLRSDTVTKPRPEMLEAISTARVGDDVYGEDPTINSLEEKAAEITGKERALFVPSGTMANQIAAMVHTRPGDEIITEKTNHIFLYEAGGLARLAGVQTHVIEGDRGFIPFPKLKEAVRDENIHFPETTLLSLENTHNRAGGRVFSPEDYKPHLDFCSERGIRTHLDGARIFNAAAALDLDVKELTRGFDSLCFCLSKGLGAPVGSLLCGNEEFIAEGRKARKILGGGMRQAGILAAAGIEALKNIQKKLERDHELAIELASNIEKMKNFDLTSPVESNILVVNYKGKLPIEKLVEGLKKEGLLVNAFGENSIRIVTHCDVDRDHIKRAGEILNKF